ncbi:MAG: ATP-binding protein [Vampirovibrionales bacterium]|nr:ATP-binding protein [Vampirovibrionales bacterium]
MIHDNQALSLQKTQQDDAEMAQAVLKQPRHLAIIKAGGELDGNSLEAHLGGCLADAQTVRFSIYDDSSAFFEALDNGLNRAEPALKQSTFVLDALICDVSLSTFEQTRQIIANARQRFTNLKIALFTSEASESWLPLMIEQEITQLWVKPVPFDLHEFGDSVSQLLSPSGCVGLHHHMAKRPELLETMHVTNSHQINVCVERFRDILKQQHVDTIDEMITCFLEALTNAIYHAPRTPSGHEKYKKQSVIDQLLPSEIVTVQFGADARKVGFSVQDQFGALSPKTLLYWLHRHQSDSGLLDTHGRGLYLMYLLADHLVVKIDAGRKTEFTLLKSKSNVESAQPHKSILIHHDLT